MLSLAFTIFVIGRWIGAESAIEDPWLIVVVFTLIPIDAITSFISSHLSLFYKIKTCCFGGCLTQILGSILVLVLWVVFYVSYINGWCDWIFNIHSIGFYPKGLFYDHSHVITSYDYIILFLYCFLVLKNMIVVIVKSIKFAKSN